MAVARYGPLESEDGARRFEIEALRPAKDHFVARLAASPTATPPRQLTNIKLYVSRDTLPPIEDDDDVLSRRPGRACRGDAGRRGARHRDGGA